MAQKFIITRRGILRMGNVSMHKDLLQHGDICMGGGFYRFDPVACRLALSGHSFDFGEPMWEWLAENHITLKVPHIYSGLTIVYETEDPQDPPYRVSEDLGIEYV